MEFGIIAMANPAAAASASGRPDCVPQFGSWRTLAPPHTIPDNQALLNDRAVSDVETPPKLVYERAIDKLDAQGPPTAAEFLPRR